MGKLEDVPSGPLTTGERETLAEELGIVDQAQAVLLGLHVSGTKPYQVPLVLCSAIVLFCAAQKSPRAALGLAIDFLQQRLANLYPAKPEQQS